MLSLNNRHLAWDNSFRSSCVLKVLYACNFCWKNFSVVLFIQLCCVLIQNFFDVYKSSEYPEKNKQNFNFFQLFTSVVSYISLRAYVLCNFFQLRSDSRWRVLSNISQLHEKLTSFLFFSFSKKKIFFCKKIKKFRHSDQNFPLNLPNIALFLKKTFFFKIFSKKKFFFSKKTFLKGKMAQKK